MLHQATHTVWGRLSHHVIYPLLAARRRHSDVPAYPLRREFGAWTVRPDRGWRSRRWITPPLYINRQIPAADRDGAADWAMDKLDIG